MLNSLKKFLPKTKHDAETFSGTERLNKILERANIAFKHNGSSAITAYQQLILRPIQSLHMSKCYMAEDHKGAGRLDPYRDFGLDYIPQLDQRFMPFLRNQDSPQKSSFHLKLGVDMLFPTCWSLSSMTNNLGAIGDGKKLGAFTQSDNHKVMWWTYLNIGWVGGGNHSLTQGIIACSGTIVPDEIYDLSPLYGYVRFNGTAFEPIGGGDPIGTPRYVELGIAFELGRLIYQNEISEQEKSDN